MAADVLNFLSAHYQGFLVAILFSFSLALLLQWVCWIFGWGRFAGSQTITRNGGRLQSLRFLIADALTKIGNDFRHLLALMLVSIFALALVYVLYASNENMGQIKEGLQAVVATLGGLVGSHYWLLLRRVLRSRAPPADGRWSFRSPSDSKGAT